MGGTTKYWQSAPQKLLLQHFREPCCSVPCGTTDSDENHHWVGRIGKAMRASVREALRIRMYYSQANKHAGDHNKGIFVNFIKATHGHGWLINCAPDDPLCLSRYALHTCSSTAADDAWLHRHRETTSDNPTIRYKCSSVCAEKI